MKFQKIHSKRPYPWERRHLAGQQGSALALTLVMCAVVGTLVGSYLYTIGTQNLSVVRSQSWNQALVVAEAGVDEAMALMNSGIQSNNFVSALIWTNVSPGVFRNETNK